ncbi:gamma-tubulin complex component 5-like [Impatiens glandulifera]|uniref:gamma-tubulin complex component 5-like n=1 Tax=Impatiens glandulifera TaxID=253017 RepID=UPI001FB16A41|nr:gamma-tubulin complex component 5-like [Impatiens glandulifera]
MPLKMEAPESLISKVHDVFSSGMDFAAPISTLRTNEVDLVQGLLHILQGLSSSVFDWNNSKHSFLPKDGIYVSHLSRGSLHAILNQIMHAATCLKLVEIIIHKVENSAKAPSPTVRAFTCCVSAWLKRLRGNALKEEVNMMSSDRGTIPTLLGLTNSLSSLCSGAQFLLKIVQGAIPEIYFQPDSSIPAADMAAYILDHLYRKLNEVCAVQGGEEDAYRMLLYIFVGSVLPYIEGLESWLFEGILDDPFEEVFFYANKGISLDEAEFWEKSYMLRQIKYQKFDNVSIHAPVKESISTSNLAKGKTHDNRDAQVCPLFLKDIAISIVSAGKSLQLIQHAPRMFSSLSEKEGNHDNFDYASSRENSLIKNNSIRSINGLTLSEVFCVSLAALVENGDLISKHFWHDESFTSTFFPLFQHFVDQKNLVGQNGNDLPVITCSEKVWYKFLVEMLSEKRKGASEFAMKDNINFLEGNCKAEYGDDLDKILLLRSQCSQNPAITVCQNSLLKNKDIWSSLNLYRNFSLPPLNDEKLRESILGGNHNPLQVSKGTNYAFGFQFGESEFLRSQADTKMLELLFPFPTLLPCFQEDLSMSEVLPFQKNSTLPSKILGWIQKVEPKTTPLPVVIIQECLIVNIKKQVDYIGKNILSKLLYDWRLMDELVVLRAIYMLGSGDLLHHFLTVIFDKVDKGETWDDDFELNMILQESIANSADSGLLNTSDSLVVSITNENPGLSADERHDDNISSTSHKSRAQGFGIHGLDSLKFTYKVSWPLELIANTEAIKKYNQVMNFLLKVRRAKYVLDKTRRWMWKGRGRGALTINSKRHWLVEQKLLHFVDAFHQYVMDRVYHSAWLELCEGMEAARSLDQVLGVHEAYLLSIQRQCFVVPDKLWALIANRINTILGLALDFYSIQQTLISGGAVSTIRARCEMEVDRIEKQFDDCIAFLLRVLSFKLNVGHFPHLADLVTRINYNYFYMSDNGNLINAHGSETVASRLGKTFSSRPD